MNKPLIEACVDSYQSCVNAWKGGADRLELCAHLAIGGCTPSPFVFRQVMEDCDHIKANILIRPRFGDFLYTEKEMELMCDEIRMFRLLGANGVVIGALTPDGDLDICLLYTSHLDPHVSSNGVSNQVTNEMYETLLTFDEDTNVVPLLAKEWSVSEDGKAYTFVLNEGIKFHDGEPFNAESVRAVYDRGLKDSSLTLQRTINAWEDVVVDSERCV